MESSNSIRIGFILSVAIVMLASVAGRMYHERLEAAGRQDVYTTAEIARR